MKELRATLYDLRGYFIPGAVMLWAIIELFTNLGYTVANSPVIDSLSSTSKGVLFAIIAYASGHMLHAIANITIDRLPFSSYPPKDYFEKKFANDFSPEQAESLYIATKDFLNITTEEETNKHNIIKGAYWPCFQFLMHLNNVETENFLGLTGFYRGMATAMLMIFPSYLLALFKKPELGLALISLAALIAGLLFLARAKRFNYYLAKTVYSNFLYIYLNKMQDRATRGEGQNG